MKKLSLIALVLIIVCTSSIAKNNPVGITTFNAIFDNDEPLLLPNSEKVEIEDNGATKIYRHKDYVIKTVSGEEPGDWINIEIKGSSDKIDLTAIGDNSYFYGVYDGHIFLKMLGQGNIWTLAAYNVAEGDMNYNIDAPIGDNGAKIEDGKLIFWKATTEYPPSVDKNCSKKKEIEDAGLYLIGQRKLIYNFATKELTKTDEYDCCGSSMI